MSPPLKGGGALRPQGESPPEGPPGESVGRPWGAVQAKYALDAHLPTEETHPQFVELDAEGDIDTKPVLLWKDQGGVSRRTYTQRFHWNRFGDTHEKLKELGNRWPAAHDTLAERASGGCENAMVALLQLKTGHSAADLITLRPEQVHVARGLPLAPSGMAKGPAPTKLLKKVLQATITLRDKTQLCHWNVEGPLFASLHVLFEQQYNELNRAADDIAERIRAFDVKVGAPAAQAESEEGSAEDMLSGLLALHEQLEDLCNQGVAAADAAGDAATVDLLGKRAADHGKASWMLRASTGGKLGAVKVVKGGATTDRAHPDRTHFLLKHANGHAYASSVHDLHIAAHAHRRAGEGGGQVFNATSEGVSAAMSAAGIQGVDPSHLRHHAVAVMASDFLSKTAKVGLHAEGFGGAHGHLRACSEHIANHFGHDPVKPGMSYVPPAVAAGYLEDAGAAKLLPNTFAKLKGQPSLKERAVGVVEKAFGSAEGREADIESVYSNMLNKLQKAKRGSPCSTIEDDLSWVIPPHILSLSRGQQSSIPTMPGPTSSTPGPSLLFSKAALQELVLCDALEKGEASYLARLAPPSGDRRARYIQAPEVLLSLLANEASEALIVPGTKFKCSYPSEDGTLVDGYLCIDDRVSRLCTFSHDGTGVRARLGVDSIRQLLLEYYNAHSKARQVGLAEFPVLDVEPVKKSFFGLPGDDDDPASDMVTLVETSAGKPEHQIVFEEASRVYIQALKRNLLGEMSDEQLREVNLALITNNYKQVVALCKADTTSPSASGGVGKTPSTTDSKPGPRGLPIGAQTERKDGTYRKEGDRDWKRETRSNRKEAKEGKAEAEGVKGESATVATLRERLGKLRAALRASRGTERGKIVTEITKLKEKMRRLRDGQEGKGEDTAKSSAGLARSTWHAAHLLNDPIEEMLRKAENHPYMYLDKYITECDGDFSDFVEALAFAPPGVCSDVHHLRMVEGMPALQVRFTTTRGR